MSWTDQLAAASFRNVPFVVLEEGGEFGRRNAIHEYPYRDTPWVEDMGRAARRLTVIGFLLEPGAVALRDRMIAAAEQPNDGQLVHPTLGTLTVSLLNFSVHAHKDRGGYFEIRFQFIEAGVRKFPTVTIATENNVTAMAAKADQASANAYATTGNTLIVYGVNASDAAQTVSNGWGASALLAASDATSLTNMVGTLSGSFGRYFGGRSLGGLSAGSFVASGLSLAVLLSQGSVTRAMVSSALAAMVAAAGAVGSTGGAASLATAVQGVAAAVLAVAIDPADALRLAGLLATYAAPALYADSAYGRDQAAMAQATAALCRRAAVAAMARAATTYQPASSDDALAVRANVCGFLDAEITIAGDNGEDDAYTALKDLRTAVVQDLTTRGADLAPIKTFTVNAPLPALVLANRLYRDPSRADALVTQVNPIHPAFMPTTFKALAA